MRVVSLLPSATEIVCIVGGTDDLVGVSHECDFPSGIRGRPVLTRSRLEPAGSSSREIDRDLRSIVSDALSVYAVDADRLAELAPDVVVTQDLCEVCAVSIDDVEAAVARLANRSAVDVVSLHATRLSDVWGDVERVAAAIGRPETGRAVRANLEERVDVVCRAAGAIGSRPRVATIEWLDPIMLGGTWMPDLIAAAGGEPVGVEPGAHAPTVTSDDLAALRPDVIVIKPCGFGLERTLAERDVIDRSIAAALPPATRIVAADGSAYFNRPGPRLAESVEILAAAIHPTHFPHFATGYADVMHRLS